jgi:hypothetical protein
MKRFIAMGGEDYYPDGGFGDFLGDFDTAQEAREASEGKDWREVTDTQDRVTWAWSDAHGWQKADWWTS